MAVTQEPGEGGPSTTARDGAPAYPARRHVGCDNCNEHSARHDDRAEPPSVHRVDDKPGMDSTTETTAGRPHRPPRRCRSLSRHGRGVGRRAVESRRGHHHLSSATIRGYPSRLMVAAPPVRRLRAGRRRRARHWRVARPRRIQPGRRGHVRDGQTRGRPPRLQARLLLAFPIQSCLRRCRTSVTGIGPGLRKPSESEPGLALIAQRSHATGDQSGPVDSDPSSARAFVMGYPGTARNAGGYAGAIHSLWLGVAACG